MNTLKSQGREEMTIVKPYSVRTGCELRKPTAPAKRFGSRVRTWISFVLAAVAVPSAASAAPGGGATEAAPQQKPQPWTLVTPAAAFSPRDCARGCLFQGKLWLSNGYFHGNVTIRDLWNSEDGKTWSLVLTDTPFDAYSEIIEFRGKLWAVKESVWSSSDGVHWTRVREKGPFGACAELFLFRDKMWALNGSRICHTVNGEDWELAADRLPLAGRTNFAFAIHEGQLWVMGGSLRKPNRPPEKGYPDTTTLNDVWRSADGVAWEQAHSRAPWSPRMWFKAASYDSRLWVFGGFDNVNHKNLGDVWHTKEGRVWEQSIAEAPWTPRHAPTLYLFGDSLYLAAGNSWPVRNDVWRLTRR